MDKFKELLAKCKCGVFVSVNEHRDYYKSVEDQLEERKRRECQPEYTDEVRDAMIESDTIVEITFFPDTPIGSYQIIHHDLDKALDMALASIATDRKGGE